MAGVEISDAVDSMTNGRELIVTVDWRRYPARRFAGMAEFRRDSEGLGGETLPSPLPSGLTDWRLGGERDSSRSVEVSLLALRLKSARLAAPSDFAVVSSFPRFIIALITGGPWGYLARTVFDVAGTSRRPPPFDFSEAAARGAATLTAPFGSSPFICASTSLNIRDRLLLLRFSSSGDGVELSGIAVVE